MFKIHDQGFWEGEDCRTYHYFDKPLYGSILNFLKNHNTQTVLDLGCGLGEYSKALRDDGFLCDCYDGNPDTPLLTN